MFKDMNSGKKKDSVEDTTAINNAIKTILLTPYGSLPGRPTFGSHIYKAVFEHLDDLVIIMIKRYTSEALDEWEPRIDVNEVHVQRDEEYNRVIIGIDYSIKAQANQLDDYTNHVKIAFRE